VAHWSRTVAILAVIGLNAVGQTRAASQPAARKPSVKSALDKATLETYLRHLNMWPPQVVVQVADAKPSDTLPGFSTVRVKASLGERSLEADYLVSPDGQKILQANVYDINWNPFREELAKLKTEGSASRGTPGATVVLVEFSDFQCSYCRELARTLNENLLKTYPTQVRLYFKDFPLDAIHPWARPAAISGRCVFRQKPTAFWDFHDWIFDKQAEISQENHKQKIADWAASNGLDMLQYNQCAASPEAAAEVEASFRMGRALEISSTPTIFVNGRRVSGNLPWEQMKQIIDGELEYQKTAKNAGEDCGCDVSLPAAAPPAVPHLEGKKK
jgi:protein-disulfide isomerase